MNAWRSSLQTVKRSILRSVIRPLMHWSPLESPVPGYTIAVACHWRFPEMFEASLLFLAEQDLTGFHALICAFDAPKTPALEAAARRIASAHPTWRIEFLYQSRLQSAVLRRINWGWVDCWLSYSKCLASARTQYVMLHDMDAMLLDRSFVRRRYECITEKRLQFLGVRWYTYNGLRESDRLLYVVEMMLDVQWLRAHCVPIDLFNKIHRFGDRRVDLDTLIFPQTLASAKMELPISGEQWVHPSQVISQFTYLAGRPGYAPPAANNLFFIPYFMHLAGHPLPLDELSARLSEAGGGSAVPFFGYTLDMRNLTREHHDWIRKQIEQLEAARFGRMRTAIAVYLSAIGACIRA